jgi:hypothetical protein
LIILSGFIAVIVGTIRLFKSIIQLIGLNHGDSRPGVHLIEAVDTYLFSLVILVLGGGIFKLFRQLKTMQRTFKIKPCPPGIDQSNWMVTIV